MGNDYESNYLTPPNEDELEYTKCEHCGGIGFIYLQDEDVDLVKEDCEFCKNGLIEIN